MHGTDSLPSFETRRKRCGAPQDEVVNVSYALKLAMTATVVESMLESHRHYLSPETPLMQENFRQFLDRLRQAGELIDLHQPVDIRHISTLVDQAKTALFFHNVIGYHMPVVSGIIRSRERATRALGCDTYGEIEHKL